jgi:hypothetical protein
MRKNKLLDDIIHLRNGWKAGRDAHYKIWLESNKRYKSAEDAYYMLDAVLSELDPVIKKHEKR